MRVHSKILLAVMSGLLVSLSFPIYVSGWKLPNCGWIAWFALVPLFISIQNEKPKRVYLLTLLSSSIWYFTSFVWVVYAMYVHGHLGLSISVTAFLLMVLLEASIISLAPYLAVRIKGGWRGELLILMPVAWATMAYVRAHFPFGGFTWSNLAMSQWEYLPLIQIADTVGIYGIIFIMVWFNYFVSEILTWKVRRPQYLSQKTLITASLLIFTVSYGLWRIGDVDRKTEDVDRLSIGLIQGNISQRDKWDKDRSQEILNIYRREAAKLAKSSVDLIVWPEAAMPWYMRDEAKYLEPFKFGIPDGVTGTLPYTFMGVITHDINDNYYNSAMLLDAQGNIQDVYHKMHMVPFGEYVPLQRLLFFLSNITMRSRSFTQGLENRPLHLGNFSFVPLICYEDTFPDISRKTVAEGANFLLNITNNAWFGETSAPFQQLALSVFRSVENRRYMLRATNTGISAIIGPTGKVLLKSGLFVKATMVVNLDVMYMNTVYTMLGDWFAMACVAYTLIGLIMILIVRRKVNIS